MIFIKIYGTIENGVLCMGYFLNNGYFKPMEQLFVSDDGKMVFGESSIYSFDRFYMYYNNRVYERYVRASEFLNLYPKGLSHVNVFYIWQAYVAENILGYKAEDLEGLLEVVQCGSYKVNYDLNILEIRGISYPVRIKVDKFLRNVARLMLISNRTQYRNFCVA